MKDLQAIRGTRILREWIAQGEHQTQDFKFAISDACKIARSLSAFANRDGGRLLIGVKDNGVIAGVRNEEDIYVVELAAGRYCRPAQTVTFQAYRIDGNLHVIAASIAPSEAKPVYAVEPDGTHRAYYRVADENIAAHPLMVRAWQQHNDGTTSAFTMNGPHTAILDYLAAHDAVSEVRRIALDLHISLQSAEEAVVSLASMGLIDFEYTGTHFEIRIANN